MDAESRTPRQEYQLWVEERIEEHKAGLTREELLELADEAVERLFQTDDDQYPLTEILLTDSVDSLIFDRLDLPSYRSWARRRRQARDQGPDPAPSSDGATRRAS